MLGWNRSPARDSENVYCIYTSCLFFTMIRLDKDLRRCTVTPMARKTQFRCRTYVQAVHRLESHKSEIDRPALFHRVFGDLQDLCHLWPFRILDILEIYCGTVDKQLDQLGPFLWIGGMQDDAFDLDRLIELVV